MDVQSFPARAIPLRSLAGPWPQGPSASSQRDLDSFHECRADFSLSPTFYDASVGGTKSLKTDPSEFEGPARSMNGNRSLPGTSYSSTANHTCKSGVDRLVTIRQDLDCPRGFFSRAIYPRFGVNARNILHVIDFPNGDGCTDCGRKWNDIKTAGKAGTLKILFER